MKNNSFASIVPVSFQPIFLWLRTCSISSVECPLFCRLFTTKFASLTARHGPDPKKWRTFNELSDGVCSRWCLSMRSKHVSRPVNVMRKHSFEHSCRVFGLNLPMEAQKDSPFKISNACFVSRKILLSLANFQEQQLAATVSFKCIWNVNGTFSSSGTTTTTSDYGMENGSVTIHNDLAFPHSTRCERDDDDDGRETRKKAT